MNDETPEPFDIVGDQPVEARIVAWVLGEASAFEAAELERLCEERPELLVFRRRMRSLHGLLTEAEASEADHSWKLPPEKRAKLDEIFGAENAARLEVVRERGIRRSGRMAILGIAACVLLTFVVSKFLGPIRLMGPMASADSNGRNSDSVKQPNSEAELQALDKAIRDQENKVEERRKTLAMITRTKGITYKGKDSFYGSSGVDEDNAARDSLKTYNELEAQKMQLESQVKSLLKYDGEPLIRYASGLDLPDNVIRGVYPQYLENQRHLSDLKIKGLGEDHPTVKAAVEQSSAMKRQVNQGIIDLRANLQSELASTTDRLRSVEVMKNGKREEAITRGLDAQDYADAKKDFEADQELLQALRLEQIKKTIEAKMPDESIVSRVMPDSPSAPPAPVAKTAPLAPPAAAQPSASPSAGFGMTLAKSKENRQEIAKRERLVAGKTAEKPEFKTRNTGVELADASPVESMPGNSSWSGSSIAGGLGGAALKPDLNRESGGFKSDESVAVTDAIPPVNALPGEITNGLRSGDQATSRNSIDAILNNPSRVAGERVLGDKRRENAPGEKRPMPTLADKDGDSRIEEIASIDARLDKLAEATPPIDGSAASEGIVRNGSGSMGLGESIDGKPSSATAIPGEPFAEQDMKFRSGRSQSSVTAGVLTILPEEDAAARGARPRVVPENGETKFARDALDAPWKSEPLADGRKQLAADPGKPADAANPSKGDKFQFFTEYEPPTLTESDARHNWRRSDESAKAQIQDRESAIRPEGGETPVIGDIPVIGKLFENNESQVVPRSGQKLNLGLSNLAQREMIRRQAPIPASDAKLLDAKSDFAKGDFQNAHDKYKQALDILPDAPIFKERRALLEKALEEASGSLAARAGNPGNLDDADEAPSGVGNQDFDLGRLASDGKSNDMPFANDMGKKLGLGMDVTTGAALRFSDQSDEIDYYADPASSPETMFSGKNADLYFDTSKLAESGKDAGGVEHEIHAGYSSDYLFRGVDLEEKGAEPAVVPLADLMEEIAASEDPYSTFSLNISDASFQLAKAALAKGERPEPESIKVEQFYNSVDYGDPTPSSDQPVAAMVEQSAHPVIPGRNLVRVALRTASVGRSATQPLRLTLLVDQSGSMVREDRRTAMEHALTQLAGLLTKDDSVTVIGFSRTPHLLADGLTGDQGEKLSGIINQTASEGGTNLEQAILLGAQKSREHQLAGAQNRIVLFTDGAANLGNANPERLAKQVTELRQQGIAFDIAGIGADGLNDRLLGELARHGNGRYYVVGDAKNDSFARQLAGAFRPAAENVKVQVNFNPQRVGRYKLIGFEKDRLKTEDFRNDAVDAAELAADEAGVALYQVEPLADGTGEIGEVSVRFRDVASGEMVERTWTIPNESTTTAFDRATPSMQLAGLSMLAAEKLKGGPLADAIDFKQFAAPMADVKQVYGASQGVADMLQVIDKLR